MTSVNSTQIQLGFDNKPAVHKNLQFMKADQLYRV